MKDRKISQNAKLSKIARQVRLYYLFIVLKKSNPKSCTPKQAMREIGIKCRRTFERDLIDLRDSGVVNAVYDRHKKVLKFYRCEFDESVTGSRRARLNHLRRLCLLLCHLSPTLPEEYHDEVDKMDDCKETGEKYIPDPDIFHDLISEYEELFPDASLRTRQRDFHDLNCVGRYMYLIGYADDSDFKIIYNKSLKTYVFLVRPYDSDLDIFIDPDCLFDD